jgi:ABC-2 type transport system permease protein
MNKIWEVTKWEYLEKIKTKAFLISMIITPIFIIAMGVLPSMLMKSGDSKTKNIGIIDLSNTIADKFVEKINKRYKLDNGKPNYSINILFKDSDKSLTQMKSEADKMVTDEKIENYIIINPDFIQTGKGEYRGINVSSIKDLEIFEKNLKSIISEIILTKKGIDVELLKEIDKSVDLKAIKINEKGGEKESGFLQTFFTSYIFIILLMMLIVMTGQLLIRSMVEEKSNRIIEILVSSCSPTDLMAGKILGLSALGLTQIFLWIIIGVVSSFAFSLGMPSLENLFLILIYFLLGYVFYAAIFVTFGSLASTEQEAQQYTGYVSMFLVLPIILAFSAMQDPNSTLIRVLSYIPLLTPTFMVLRIPIMLPPIWEIVLTIVIMIGSTIGMIWIAGKVFRTGILMYGKAPKPKELIRWLMTK